MTASAEHAVACNASVLDCPHPQLPVFQGKRAGWSVNSWGCGVALWEACCSRCCTAQLRGDCRQLLQSLVDALREPGCALPASMVERVGT